VRDADDGEQEQNLAYECINGVYEWISCFFLFFVAVAGMMKTTFK